MTVRIDALDPTVIPQRDHEFPAMRDGVTVKLTVAQILALIEKGDLPADVLASLDLADSALQRNQAREDVASATTTDIGAAASQYIRITGTVQIAGLGTAAAGVARDVLFGDALTLTHNATSLILPGGDDIPTQAGDTALFRSEGSGNWRCVRYQRASGAAVIIASAGLTLLSVQTVSSAVAAVDFTTGIDATHDEYEISFHGVLPATNDADLWLRVSDDAGATFKTASFLSSLRFTNSGGGSGSGISTSAVIIVDPAGTGGVSNVAQNGGVSGVVRFEPNGASARKVFRGESAYRSSGAGFYSVSFSGQWDGGNAAINGIRFVFDTGNVAAGTFRLWGRQKNV
jgi:hypothetical protein